MLLPHLPSELWREIFGIAVDHDRLLDTSLTSPLAESQWFRMIFGDWWLRQPAELLQLQQRRGNAVKKAINLTCRTWARIGVEFMYRCVLVSDPHHLRKLCSVLDTNAKLGCWIKAIYVYNDGHSGVHDLSVKGMDDCVVSLIRHCPNLQVFRVDPHIGNAFAPVADSLRTYCATSLKSLQWMIPYESQTRVVPALSCMRALTALQIQLAFPLTEQEKTLAGLRSLAGVSFPCLKQLSLRGAIQDFAEEVANWHMPELDSLTIDFKGSCHDLPDMLDVVHTHGPQLKLLDINGVIAPDVPSILLICSNLTTFCFNLDWPLEGVLTEQAHAKLENICLYGLRHAFGVGYLGELAVVNPFHAIMMRRMNDINFEAITKENFPNLRLVRVLEPNLLNDLNKNNGPAEGVCYSRWERWWEQCASQHVRLEDCTGSLLGTLPQDDEDEDGSDFEAD